MTRGLMIAAPRSGSGKTTITLGLQRAYARQGLKVRGLKGGPDYIDPAFHAAATGAPSYNLDSFAMDAGLIHALAGEAARGADLVIAEGSMGLFDGVRATEGRTGASADIAALCGFPIVLVIDVSGQAQSAAAIALGCKAYDPRITIAGVILNKVASARHERLVRDGMSRIGMKVFGALPREAGLILPERHLGLVQAGETADLADRLDRLAAAVTAAIDLDALHAAAADLALPGTAGDRGTANRTNADLATPGTAANRTNANLTTPGTAADHATANLTTPGSATLHAMAADFSAHAAGLALSALPAKGWLRPPGQRIAIARDAAFSFIYPHVELGWRRAGAELVPFSPLADEGPDKSCDACWLPGGYPELHAGTLANARQFRAAMIRFAETRPVHGECGGYMVLGESLEDADGKTHDMLALLPVRTSFARRKLNLGYRIATLNQPSSLGPPGTKLIGHEFHYATEVSAPTNALATIVDAEGAAQAATGHQVGRVSGSFFHAIAVG